LLIAIDPYAARRFTLNATGQPHATRVVILNGMGAKEV
jgi:hypothetical protein